MRRVKRALISLVAVLATATSLAACEANSFTYSCSGEDCTMTIEGDNWNDFPMTYDRDDSTGDSESTITLLSATQGGEAVIETDGVENRCTQGESFVVADTTITCDVVGDRKVELSSIRQ